MEVNYINNMSAKLIIISSPERVPTEITRVISLFRAGLQQFHIRKPGFTDFDMINYISSIPAEFRKFLVLHSHFYLAKDFGLKGIQVGKGRTIEAIEYKNSFKYYGYSAHSFDEILEHKDDYTHFFLSPVFNSISKKDYKSGFITPELSSFLQDNHELKIVALGGIDANNSRICINLGFAGIALLGAIWQQKDSLSVFNEIHKSLNSRPYSLSIAGFDPCSGAGVTADIKTFEQHKVQGLGVNTAITYQNESEFLSVDWLTVEQIEKQIEILFRKYNPTYVKIGLIENFEVLKQIISSLKERNKNVKIIWDPILKASADFDFHNRINRDEVLKVLKDIYLITPNIPECLAIFGTDDYKKVQDKIYENNLCKVLIKGGHSNKDDVTDILIEKNEISFFKGQRIANRDKHGTGCVLSSAICSNLSNGLELPASIKMAKNYITDFIDSNNGLLGFHNKSNH